jgi:hypothetical protein
MKMARKNARQIGIMVLVEKALSGMRMEKRCER